MAFRTSQIISLGVVLMAGGAHTQETMLSGLLNMVPDFTGLMNGSLQSGEKFLGESMVGSLIQNAGSLVSGAVPTDTTALSSMMKNLMGRDQQFRLLQQENADDSKTDAAESKDATTEENAEEKMMEIALNTPKTAEEKVDGEVKADFALIEPPSAAFWNQADLVAKQLDDNINYEINQFQDNLGTAATLVEHFADDWKAKWDYLPQLANVGVGTYVAKYGAIPPPFGTAVQSQFENLIDNSIAATAVVRSQAEGEIQNVKDAVQTVNQTSETVKNQFLTDYTAVSDLARDSLKAEGNLWLDGLANAYNELVKSPTLPTTSTSTKPPLPVADLVNLFSLIQPKQIFGIPPANVLLWKDLLLQPDLLTQFLQTGIVPSGVGAQGAEVNAAAGNRDAVLESFRHSTQGLTNEIASAFKNLYNFNPSNLQIGAIDNFVQNLLDPIGVFGNHFKVFRGRQLREQNPAAAAKQINESYGVDIINLDLLEKVMQ